MTNPIDADAINPVLAGGRDSIADDLTAVWSNQHGEGEDPTSAPLQESVIPEFTVGGVTDTIGNHLETASANATSAATKAQAGIDAIVQGATGVSGTGNSSDAVAQIMAAYPAASIAPPINPASVLHGASGAGNFVKQAAAQTISTSAAHTPAAGDNYLLVPIFYQYSGTTVPTRVVNYGVQAMNSRTGPIALNAAAGLYVEFFELFNPDGPQTVSAQLSTPTATLTTLGFYSDSYSGVQSVTSAINIVSGAGGTNTVNQFNVPSASGDMVYQLSAGYFSGTGAEQFTSYNQTQQHNSLSAAFTDAAGDSFAIAAGDAAGAATVSFTAVGSRTFTSWLGIAINLVGDTGQLGSVFKQAHTTGTQQNMVANIATLFKDGWYETNVWGTPDLLYNPVGNTLTVTEAGTYTVKINQMLTAGSTYRVQPVLFHNGSPIVGVTSYISAAAAYSPSGFNVTFGDSFEVYCNAGDTLQPGYKSDSAISSGLGGESTGEHTWWSVALDNRSLL